jgi:hypothetical protein
VSLQICESPNSHAVIYILLVTSAHLADLAYSWHWDPLFLRYLRLTGSLQESDIALAKGLVEQDRKEKKILELSALVESDTLEGRIEGKYRTVHIKVFF